MASGILAVSINDFRQYFIITAGKRIGVEPFFPEANRRGKHLLEQS